MTTDLRDRQGQWVKPVYVRCGNFDALKIDTVSQAYEFLVRNWHSNKSDAYARALDMCDDRKGNYAPRERARDAFISACVVSVRRIDFMPAYGFEPRFEPVLSP
ncbi:DUF982 domain-containing protein (plasmid) [Agrobacterium salinitolerans]|uniref:DUF982 domain-containing protein n=1 Tax=Agrobacterium salinitolerans TaxID=1183413 RepID=UPI001C226F02|nr:DUF982 domain-containing protein [Agrobacterium salinitolerans]